MLIASVLALAAVPAASSQVEQTPSEQPMKGSPFGDTMIARLKQHVAATSRTSNPARVTSTSTPFRFSPRNTNGHSSIGEWWLTANAAATFSATPDPSNDARFRFDNPAGEIALRIRLETGWQLYFECSVILMNAPLHWKSETTVSPNPDEGDAPGNGPIAYFVTSQADGTAPDYVSTITLTSVNRMGPRPSTEFELIYCDVLPFTMS